MTTNSNNTNRRKGATLRSRLGMRVLLATLSLATGLVRLGATEYFYGIGTDWNLYQISINGSTVTTTAQLNLSGYVTGFGTHNNDYLNGLGIDQSTGSSTKSYSSVTAYSNWDHTSLNDGDFVIGTQGSIQVAGLGQSTNLYVISSTGKTSTR